MEVEFSAQDHPNLGRWFKEMRALPICAADLKRARDYVVSMKDRNIEKRWRGDRIEWMLARGFHDWFFKEIEERRVLWPGPATGAFIADLGAVAAGGYVDIDVSSYVNGDGIYSFVIVGESSDVTFFSSREGANPPQLVVTPS